MPGRHLNDAERALAREWRDPRRYPYPVLRRLRVSGDSGLRGIHDLSLELDYPLTVLVGKNGTGKSTLLALAALAFHTVPGHIPVNALRRPKRGEDSTYYTFSDFVFRGPGDSAAAGVTIDWAYDGPNGPKTITVRRTSDRKWMKYERRPRRPVHFVGISRTVPAIERRVLRDHFAMTSSSHSESTLDAGFLERLSRIMGRPYDAAAVLEAKGYQLRRARTSAPYSSFNMGAGEDVLIELLHLLQLSPPGSLVVVEEIELGLHPQAVRALAKELLEIALRKKLQLVVSSHSPDFIDRVPRDARVMLQRSGNEHVVAYQPTARFAIGELSGESQSELVIACEDEFSAALIRDCLDGPVRRRSRIVPVGTKQSLIDYADYHLRSGNRERLMLVWDGDVGDGEIKSWVARLQRSAPSIERVGWTRLPGSVSPEAWAISQLGGADGLRVLAEETRESETDIKGHLADLAVLPDQHDLDWALARRFNRPASEMRSAVVRALRIAAADELDGLRSACSDSLDADPVRSPELPETAAVSG